jgi:hypothetical protein
LDTLFEVLDLLSHSELQSLRAVLTKEESYLSRFFGPESWSEWVEGQSALGRVVALWDAYAASMNGGVLLRSQLDAGVVRQALSEAADYLHGQATMIRTDSVEQTRRLDDGYALSLLGAVDTQDRALLLAVVDSIAYVTDDDSGLQIIDVSNPTNPSLLGSLDTSGDALGVAVAGSIAYVATGGVLELIDVSNPATPSLLSSVDCTYYTYTVTVVGSIAYVGDWAPRLLIIDVSNPTNPFIRGSYSTPGGANGIAIVNSIAYVDAYKAHSISLTRSTVTMLFRQRS